MFNHLRLSYSLLRLASSVLDRRKEKFKKELENLGLNERVLDATLDCLVGIKEHLIRKMCVHWLKKKSIILPEDLPKVEKAYKLAKDNRGVDYLKFDSPVEIIDKFEEKAKIEFDKLIKPDSLPELYNKVDLGDGVTVYTVEDSKAGQYAVRKLADTHFGERFDNWCIIYRLRDKYTTGARDDMGMMVDSYEEYWKHYNAYPKRIAFKYGRLISFCASDTKEVRWWDKNDRYSDYIPKHENLGDDDEFINEHIVKGLIKDWKSGKADKLVLASNRYSTVEILADLSNDEDWTVRSSIAGNPNTPVDVLVKLSDDEDSDVRSSVAMNSNIPTDILEGLSSDEYYSVRCCVAQNPNTPANVLVKLFENENEYILQGIAENPNAPVEILVKLSSDDDKYVRSSVARNPNTPVDILVKLSNDEDGYVRGFVAQNPKVKINTLVKLSRDEDKFVRCNVVENPKVPEGVLIELSNDEEWEVRGYVAECPNVPEDVLLKLSKDNESYVSDKALGILRSRGIDV